MVRVKLCGIRRDEDIDYVNELLPDYIGFIFDSTKRRYITPERAQTLRQRLDSRIVPVGVFVNADMELILSVVKTGAVGAVQLHGDETEEQIRALKEKIQLPMIKAFTIGSREDIERAKNSCADYILLDSGMGTGNTFDHSLIGSIGRKFFLAGGMTPENVNGIVKRYKPFAVDASSSLETDGVKDKIKMAAFMRAVGR